MRPTDNNDSAIIGRMLMTVLVACAAIPGVLQADECDFIAMLAQNGTFIHEDQTNADDSFDFLKQQSNATDNPDGYGVVYYNTDPEMVAGQRFHATLLEGYTEPVCYYCGEQAEMNDAITAIYTVSNNAKIVLGHDRNGTGGIGNHPFWFDWNGRTYSMIHNGDLTNGAANCLKEALFNGLTHYPDGWFPSNFSNPGEWSNWLTLNQATDINNWIDSELWFHYLLSYIVAENGDVLTALLRALNETNFYNFDVRAELLSNAQERSVVNFVLSDGESIYCFRNSYTNDSGHEMSWVRYPGDLIAVKTGALETGATQLARNDLVYIPIEGSIAHFDGVFEYEGGEFDVYTYDDYNWVCYPILPVTAGPGISSHFSQITPWVDDMRVFHEDDIPAIWNGVLWNPGDINNLISTQGYKVKVLEGDYDEYNHIVTGEEVINPVSFVTLHDGINYIPYFLEIPQHPSEAFPQNVLDNMLSIEAEDWFMVRINDEFYVKRKCPAVTEPEYIECFTLYYGAMYVLNMDLTGTIDFIYNQPQDPLELFTVPTPENYVFDDGREYLKVVIEEIENGEDVIEIGAFQNGVCVGAEVVDGYPINLRVYADNLDGVTYEVITEEPVYRRVPGETPPPARRTLAPAARRYLSGATLLELTEITGLSTMQPSVFSAVNASPDPFNPSTEINFLLNHSSDVTLKVYNVRGQLVSTLLNGSLESGYYSYTWDGSSAASGVYYFRLSDGTEQISQKMILLK